MQKLCQPTLGERLTFGTKLARIVCVGERQPILLAQDLHRLAWHENCIDYFGKKTPDFNFILYDIIIYLTKSVIREIIRYTKNKGDNMINLDYIYDVIDAAKSDKAFDKANIKDIADLHGVCPEHVAVDIATRRQDIEEVKEARKSLATFKNELDKLG